MNRLASCCCTLVVLALAALSAYAAEVRYLAATGDDAADGKTPATAWRTVEKLNADLPAGATALLKRGDVFYGTVRPPAGPDAAHRTTLAAYGAGPKPVISCVKIIRPDPAAWEDCSHCSWRVNLRNPTNFTGIATEDDNAGFLVVDGEVKAWKRFCPSDLVTSWDFCGEDGWLYVHADDNPARVSKDIRVALNEHGVRFGSHTAISNIAVCATGAHGMYSGWDDKIICEDIRITDCDFENIGGSELPNFKVQERLFRIRYGNGIELGSNCRDAVVERCTFRGVYDVAVTMQGYPRLTGWEDIHVRDCTMTDCTQAFEVWCSDAPKGKGFSRCTFTGNRTRRVGGGWGELVRPKRTVAVPLLVYCMETDTVDITVSGNVFEDAPRGLIYKSGGAKTLPSGYRVYDNICKNIGPGQIVPEKNSKPKENK